jgi:hypothetical protein
MTTVTYTVSVPSQRDYAFPFEALDDSHVEVQVDGVIQTSPTHFTANLATSTVSFKADLVAGNVIVIRRNTPRTIPVVTFTNGARELADKLNKQSKQPLFVIEETDETGTMQLDGDGNWNAQSRKIANLVNPVSAQQAATKAYTDGLVSDALGFQAGASPGIYQWPNANTPTQEITPTAPTGVSYSPGTWELYCLRGYEWHSLPPTSYTVYEDAGALKIDFPNTDVFLAVSDFEITYQGTVTDYLGNATTAGALSTARNIELTGAVTGAVPFDGSADVAIATTLANKTGGSFIPTTVYTNANVSFDAQGRVQTAANGAGASDFIGATSSDDGERGLVPVPLAVDRYDFLRGDGTWTAVDSVNGRQVFTSNGTFNVPPGVRKVKLTIIGAGRANVNGRGSGYNGARGCGVISVGAEEAIAVTIGADPNPTTFGAYASAPCGVLDDTERLVSGTAASSLSKVVPAIYYSSTKQTTLDVHHHYYGMGGSNIYTPTGNTVTATLPGAPGLVIVEW